MARRADLDRGHEPWCEDQACGHAGACVLYGGSVAVNGTVVATTAEPAGDSGVVVIVTTTPRFADPVRLTLPPGAALVLGRGLVRLGSLFTGGRSPRRSPTDRLATPTSAGGVSVSR